MFLGRLPIANYPVEFKIVSGKVQLKHRWLSEILPSGECGKLLMLTGARQVGKTTLAKEFYRSLPYVSCDVFEERQRLESLPTYSWVDSGRCWGCFIPATQVFDSHEGARTVRRILGALLLGGDARAEFASR